MPPQKKGFTNNKKGRKAKSSRQASFDAPPAPAAAAAAGRRGPRSRAPILPGDVPDFSEYKQRSPLSKNYGTIYTRYKEATNRFYDFMMDQTPEDVRGKPCVNALVFATDWMQETQFVLPKAVLKDLKMAIGIRSRVAKSVYGGGDEGHKYFLSVLLYCWTILIALPRSESARETHDESEVEAGESNRYAVLEEEIDDDDEDADGTSEFFPSSPVARPEPQPEPMTLEELLEAEYRHDAALFLFTINELMGIVSRNYELVSKNYKVHTSSANGVSLALVETMLEAAVTTNMAIQEVQALEMALQEQHPHLSTPCRVLSAVVLPEIALKIAGILKEHSNKTCSEQEIICFVGDCLECALLDTQNRNESIVKDFCAASEVDGEGKSQLREEVRLIHSMVAVEVPIGKQEEEEATQWHRESRSDRESENTSSTHSWLRSLKFIGGDRAIYHTIRLLHWFGAIIQSTPEGNSITPLPGDFFGASWKPGQGKTTHGDLDGLLMYEIMPQLLDMCRVGIIGKVELPFEHELCPLFVAFRNYVKSPTKSVSWSLAFAVHAVLTAIFETGADVDKLTVFQKDVFTDFFDNVKWAMQLAQSERDFCRGNDFAKKTGLLFFLKNLGNNAFDSRGLWNPLCGGTILSYVAYFGNLEMGCALVDCNAQLRITLHLFNALLVNGIIDPGQVPFLDMLHSTFNSSRGVWEGPLPERGQFVQRFWICYGMNLQDAKHMAEKARRYFQGGRAVQRSSSLHSEDMPSLRQRTVKPIDPAQVSTSFRRICKRDFRGVQYNHYTPEVRRRMRDTEIYEFCVRANDTVDAIYREQQLLGFNWPSCGAILEKFVCSLSRAVQLDPLLSNAIASSTMLNDKRSVFVILFAQQLLGALDFADTPGDYIFQQVPIVQASADFMSTYFDRIYADKALSFQAQVWKHPTSYEASDNI